MLAVNGWAGQTDVGLLRFLGLGQREKRKRENHHSGQERRKGEKPGIRRMEDREA